MNKLIVLALLASTLTACSSQQDVTENENIPPIITAPQGTGMNGQKGNANAAMTGGLKQGNGGGTDNYYDGENGQVKFYDPNKAITLANLNNPLSPLGKKVIYFGYDQSTITPEYRRILKAHAQLLKKYPKLQMRIEGHADERGTRDYNVALSEKRAKTVEWFMKGQGLNNVSMKTVAYGEEKPVIVKSDEKSWSENRRVELHYPK